MYTLDKKVLNQILEKNFKSFIGILCERVEELEKMNLSQDKLIRMIKFDLKKDSYTAMRTIEEQIALFSEGVLIQVKLEKPLSE